MMLALFLLFATCSTASVVLPNATDVAVYSVIPRNWRASNPPILGCQNGLIPALLEAIGIDSDSELGWKITGLFNGFLTSPSTKTDSSTVNAVQLGDVVSLLRALQSDSSSYPIYRDSPQDFASLTNALPQSTSLFLFSHLLSDIINQLVVTTNVTFSNVLFQNFLPAKIYLQSPGTNILSAGCKAMERALDTEATPTTLRCQAINFFEAFMACRPQSSISKIECHDPALLNANTWLPTYCKPKFGPKKDQVIDMSNYFVDVFEQLTHFNVSKEHPLPSTIPQSIVDDEGFLYFLLFRATQDAQLHVTARSICGRTLPIRDLLPGWETKLIISLKESDLLGQLVNEYDYPFVFVSQPRSTPDSTKSHDIVILVRPTVNTQEWRSDLRTDQLDWPYQANPKTDGMKVHAGFLVLLNAALPPLDVYLNKMLKSCSDGQKLRVLVTGHSLGAGVGQLLALSLAQRYTFKVSAVFFGVPHVFNPQTAELFGQLVNARIISHELDAISAAPCSIPDAPRGYQNCGESAASIFAKRRASKSSAAEPLVFTGSGLSLYTATPGHVPFPESVSSEYLKLPEHFGFIEAQLNTTSQILTVAGKLEVAAPLQFGAAHVCSYGCFFSTYCNAEEAAKEKGVEKPKQTTFRCTDTCTEIMSGIDFNKSIPLK